MPLFHHDLGFGTLDSGSVEAIFCDGGSRINITIVVSSCAVASLPGHQDLLVLDLSGALLTFQRA